MTQQLIQAVVETASMVPFDLIGLPYSPALLLDGRLSASVTDDHGFRSACEWGFDCYLGEIECDERGLWTTTRDEARVFVQSEMLHIHPAVGQVPLVDRVGVVLGWLSALAFTQYHEAMEGLRLLTELMECETGAS